MINSHFLQGKGKGTNGWLLYYKMNKIFRDYNIAELLNIAFSAFSIL